MPPSCSNPVDDGFTGTGSLQYGHYFHTATLLTNGNVLVTGGGSGTASEVYRPPLGTWAATTAGALMANGLYSAAALLPNGRVLIVGVDNFTQLYDPATDGFVSGPTVGDAFYEGFTLTPLPNGKVLLAGHGGTVLGTALRPRGRRSRSLRARRRDEPTPLGAHDDRVAERDAPRRGRRWRDRRTVLDAICDGGSLRPGDKLVQPGWIDV